MRTSGQAALCWRLRSLCPALPNAHSHLPSIRTTYTSTQNISSTIARSLLLRFVECQKNHHFFHRRLQRGGVSKSNELGATVTPGISSKGQKPIAGGQITLYQNLVVSHMWMLCALVAGPPALVYIFYMLIFSVDHKRQLVEVCLLQHRSKRSF